jgi:hypothetical protein
MTGPAFQDGAAMLPAVDFCGIPLTRLVIGANPFGGFSHQSEGRDRQMREYHTPERVLETWDRAWKAGINAFVTNNESPHVVESVRRYKAAGGPMTWIAQVNAREKADRERALDEVAGLGARALYLHGAITDGCFARKDEAFLRQWLESARRRGLVAGVAAHNPAAHHWVDSLGAADFHAVPFFNCGSVHDRTGGERFVLEDMAEAVKFIRGTAKPCLAYKVLGAGRLDARMGLDYAFRNIKPGDAVNLGMHRGDNDGMVEENARLAEELINGGA